MLRMVSYPHRPLSGQITCYLNRTYHVLPTVDGLLLDSLHVGAYYRPETRDFCGKCHAFSWKVTQKLTWTFGVRDTFNSNPLNPHDQIARLGGSFSSISHDVSQPLNAAIQTHLGNLFSSTPLAILQPRTAIAWQFEPKSVLRAGFGIFSDILPGSVADLIGTNPPYDKTFQGGLLGTVAGLPSLRECRAVQWMQLSPQIKDLVRDSLKGSFRAHPRRQIPQRASHPSQSRRCPLALCMLRTSWSGAWELNINSAPRRVCWRDMWEHAR